MNPTYTASQMADIVTRHRQLSAAEHRKYVALGFALGAGIVMLLWRML